MPTDQPASTRTPVMVEIAVDSVEGAIAAEAAGAARIELGSGLFEGGLTPSAGLIEAVIAACGLPVHVLVRPRAGDFLYSAAEREVMLRDAVIARAAGARGVVFGALTVQGAVDTDFGREFIDAAQPMKVTFHRAFDMAAAPMPALEAIMALGIGRLLTSGQEGSALEGAPLIAQLIHAAGPRLRVVPAGGVNHRNLARIVAATGAVEVHASATEVRPGAMAHRNPRVFMGGTLRPAEYDRPTTSGAMARALVEAANSTPQGRG